MKNNSTGLSDSLEVMTSHEFEWTPAMISFVILPELVEWPMLLCAIIGMYQGTVVFVTACVTDLDYRTR